MNRVGFLKSEIVGEERIALLPDDIKQIEHPELLFFQKGYGVRCGIKDREYKKAGAKVVTVKKAAKLEVICQTKFYDEDFPTVHSNKLLRENQILFGWLHLFKEDIPVWTLKNLKATVIEWSLMFDENNKYVFEKNRIRTGELGVEHALNSAGKKASESKIAVIGRGRVGTGAIKKLIQLGAKDLTIYHTGNFLAFKRWIGKYDVVVYCAKPEKTILDELDLSRMKPKALLALLATNGVKARIDVQTITKPLTTMFNKDLLVYFVTNIPTLAYKEISTYISKQVAPYINKLVNGTLDTTLRNAITVDHGKPLTDRLN